VTKTFASLEAFHAADPARRGALESDLGCEWHQGNAAHPRYMVSYLKTTGELIARCLDGSTRGQVRVLGIVPPDPYPGRPWYATLDAILDGWENLSLAACNLRWIEGRLARANAANGRPSLPPGGGSHRGDVYWTVPGPMPPQTLTWEGPAHRVHLRAPGERPGWTGEDLGPVTVPCADLSMAQQAVAEWWAARQSANAS
jgi:hypothetical protein